MSLRSSKDIGALFREGTPIDEAYRRAFENTVRRHREAGVPLILWENGQIVHVPADQIPLPEDEHPNENGNGRRD
ncbi:MAG TPA: hypothetical protein VHG91_05400 [Longimicrobium sp.]|nr:hypothetical protein [Longimicrobium sp.]